MRISGWLLVNAFTGVFADPVGSSYATGTRAETVAGETRPGRRLLFRKRSAPHHA